MATHPIVEGVELDFSALRVSDFGKAFRDTFSVSFADAQDLLGMEVATFFVWRLARRQLGVEAAGTYDDWTEKLSREDADIAWRECQKQIYTPADGGFTGDSPESPSTPDESPEN